jgi:LuxR family maltose regulon positive regulatory protein
MVIIANANLADILLEQGQLHPAARVYTEALRMAALPDGQISPLAGSLHAGLSRIAYEWNQLDEAAEHARQCIGLARRWGSSEYEAIGAAVLAGLELGRGDHDKAQEALGAAERCIEAHPLAPWRSAWLKAALARLWIARGNLGRAADLVQHSGIPRDGAEIAYLQEPLHLILLRLHLARGEYDAALALAERLLGRLEATSRLGRVIEVLALQSLAFQGMRDMDQALSVLGRALALAQPQGFTRLFLDEGEPMAKLLFQAKAHRVGEGYAAELLSAVGGVPAGELPPAQALIEPLTPRELEVLRLIEAGYSNQDIAGRLVISMPTVKRHISNIYAKLGAESRTQAVSMGRELGLFQ